MAWSDAARAAARLARQRRSLKMKDLRKGVRSTERDLFRARVNLENFSNPDWVRKGGWGQDYAKQRIRESRSIIESNRRLSGELSRRAKLLSPAQKDAIYARKQRKAGKSSIFGGRLFEKKLKGFER